MDRFRLVATTSFLVVLLLPWSAPGQAQVSRNATLLANVNAYVDNTGVWGYVHTDGREYAVVGTRTGTSILSLATPTAPVEVAFIPGATAGSRDIRQYQTYLYIVANFVGSATAGIQVVSMADPDHPALAFTETATINEAEYVNVDASRALLFASEADEFTGPGGVRIFSLADPIHPALVGSYAPTYRIHDFHPNGNVGYGCGIDNGRVDVVDITNPAAPTLISSFATPQFRPHSSWTTPDGRYLVVTDEDFAAPGGHPAVFDVLNPLQVKLVYESQDLSAATSHIPSMRGTTAAISYYTAGVRLWDFSVPSQPVEFGYYDTWSGDDYLLAGCYQASAYLPSGIVLATDDGTGLYVIQPSTAYGIVRGVVQATSMGMKPLAGVRVHVLPSGPETMTGADGRYALAPGSGNVTIQADKYGLTTQTASVLVTTGSDQQVNFALPNQPTGSVKGTVTRATDGSLFTGVDVTIPNSPFAAVTGAKANYSFAKVATGPLNVRAEYVGFTPISTPLNLTTGQHATADFALSPTPYYDDAETDRGWTFGIPGDDATLGVWVRAVPIGTMNGPEQAEPATDHTPGAGTFCFVTGNTADAASSSVKGGKTTLVSPVLDLSAVSDPRIVFWRWYYHNHLVGGALALSQPFVTEISNDGGLTWTTVSLVERSLSAWVRIEIRVTDYFPLPGSVRLRFTAQNRVPGTFSFTEAALDDIEYYSGVGGNSAVLASAGPGTSAGVRATGLAITAVSRPGSMSFRVVLPDAAVLRATVVDVRGRTVATLARGPVDRGPLELRWDGRSGHGLAGNGVYFLRVVADGASQTRKFVWVR